MLRHPSLIVLISFTVAASLLLVVGCDRNPTSDRGAPVGSASTTTATTITTAVATATTTAIAATPSSSSSASARAAAPKCGANQHYDDMSKKCRPFGECPKGYHWNEPMKTCLMDLEDDSPPSASGGAAAAAPAVPKCKANQHYDGISKKCRPHGECPTGYQWNENMKTCVVERF